MESQDMKKCPYCAELIKQEAIKCRYCGSMLTEKKVNLDFLSTPGYWSRVNEGKKVAGVCTGISRQLDSPVLILPLRVFFILTTIFYGFGFILYIILWALMAPPADGPGTTMAGNHMPPAAGTPSPPPSPKPAPPDDDFDYVEGSTPAPEEFTPSPESTSSDENTDEDNSIQKRLMLLGVFGTLTVITFLAGKAYIGLMRDLMLPIPFQLPFAAIVIGAIFFALQGNRSKQHRMPVRVAAE